jgi:branched-chain amino acid aminotransferase
MNHCYLNGKILPYQQCNLHISDLLLQRGYGVFDFFRVRNGEITWLEDYTDRLFTSVRLSGIELDLTREAFSSTIYSLLEKNNDQNSAFKVIITGGYSDNLDGVNGDPNFIILNVPWNSPPQETFGKGVNLITSHYTRPDPEIKTLNYFNLLKLRKKMKEFSAVDVLYHNDKIAEASRANAFFVKEDKIYTPANGILKGVTRKHVLGLIGEPHIEDIPFERLYEFDEMFITSTSRDVTPVVSIDGKEIGNGRPGKVTREIMDAFRIDDY